MYRRKQQCPSALVPMIRGNAGRGRCPPPSRRAGPTSGQRSPHGTCVVLHTHGYKGIPKESRPQKVPPICPPPGSARGRPCARRPGGEGDEPPTPRPAPRAVNWSRERTREGWRQTERGRPRPVADSHSRGIRPQSRFRGANDGPAGGDCHSRQPRLRSSQRGGPGRPPLAQPGGVAPPAGGGRAPYVSPCPAA